MKISQYFRSALLLFISLTFAPFGYAYTIKNLSSFYIFAKESPGCPARIGPGDTATTTQGWCGFIACGADNFDVNDGCKEPDMNRKGDTMGGYATWFSILPASNSCNVSEGNPYECTYSQTTGEFNLKYKNITQKYMRGSKVNQPVVLTNTPQIYPTGMFLRGVNISGMEYNGVFLDALFQKPDIPELLYYADKGFNTIRLPIRWEFIVADSSSNLIESHNATSPVLNDMYLDAVHDTVKKYLDNGFNVILDLHNYQRFCDAGAQIGQSNAPAEMDGRCKLVTKEELAYIWGVLADRFQDLAVQYNNPEQVLNSNTADKKLTTTTKSQSKK